MCQLSTRLYNLSRKLYNIEKLPTNTNHKSKNYYIFDFFFPKFFPEYKIKSIHEQQKIK